MNTHTYCFSYGSRVLCHVIAKDLKEAIWIANTNTNILLSVYLLNETPEEFKAKLTSTTTKVYEID